MSKDPKYKNRDLMIKIGTKMKEIDEDVWINYVLSNINKDENYIIDDLRFMNEYNRLKYHNWFMIKIKIDDDLQLQRLKAIYPETWETHAQYRSHNSENDLWNLPDDAFDLILDANEDFTNIDILENDK